MLIPLLFRRSSLVFAVPLLFSPFLLFLLVRLLLRNSSVLRGLRGLRGSCDATFHNHVQFIVRWLLTVSSTSTFTNR